MLDKKNGKLNSRKKCSCSCATSIGTPPQPESLTLTLPIQLTIGFSLPSVRFFLFFFAQLLLYYFILRFSATSSARYPFILTKLKLLFTMVFFWVHFVPIFCNFFFLFLFCSELARRIYIYIYMYTFFIRISRWHKVFYILEGGYPSWCSAPPANFILGEFSSFFYAAAFGGFRLKSNHLQTAIEIYNRHVNQIPIAYFK